MRPMRPHEELRRRAERLGAAVVAAALGAVLLALALPAASGRAAAGLPAGLRPRANLGVSQASSARVPHWACPDGPCEAIVDPHPVKTFAGYALPGGPLLEGGGELGGYDP